MSAESDRWLVDRLRAANVRLEQLLVAKDAEIEALRLAKDAEIAEWRAVSAAQDERIKAQDERLMARDLKIAELQRRLGAGSDDSLRHEVARGE